MSTIVKKRVNLEFINTGLQFEDIAIGDENQTLGEFIERTLIRLEVNYNVVVRVGSINCIHCFAYYHNSLFINVKVTCTSGSLMVCGY